MKYIFLINLQSGSGKGLMTWHSIHHYLENNKINYDYQISEYEGHPRRLALQALHQFNPFNTCLVIIGGDGTLHEVLSGLVESRQDINQRLPFAYIPAGTGNDFARGARIPFQPLAAFKQILQTTHPRMINLGHYENVNQHTHGIFLNNFGTGFDAAIVENTNNSKAKDFLNRYHLGSLSYTTMAIKVLFTQQPFHVQVIQDGQTYDFPRAFLTVTTNHPYLGGGIKLAPDQQLEKKQLELVIVQKKSTLGIVKSMLKFAAGKIIYTPEANLFYGQNLHYKVWPAQFAQLDGVIYGPLNFDLKMSCLDYPMWQ